MEKCGCRSVIKIFSVAPFRLTDVNLTMPSTVLYAIGALQSSMTRKVKLTLL